MTVETDLDRAQYATNATTGPWTVPFYFFKDEDLQVTYTDASGVETLLALGTDYSVTGAGDAAGGTIATTQAYAIGGTVTILRDVLLTQDTEYVDGDAFPAKSHERALDRLTMICQQLREKLSRTLGFGSGEAALAPLPPPAERAGFLLGFDANGAPMLSATAASAAIGFTSETQTASAGQTVFTLTTTSYLPGGNNIAVFVDGFYCTGDFVQTSSTRLTYIGGVPLAGTEQVTFLCGRLVGISASAANVAFQQSGAGTAQRSAQDKARERYSVTDLIGVDPTGVASSDVGLLAFLAQISASPAKLRGVFPAGTYLFSTPLNFAISNAVFEAEGEVHLRYTGTGDAVLFDAGTTGAANNVKFRGNFIIDAPTTAGNAIYVRGCHRSYIEARVRGAGVASAGLHVDFAVCTDFAVRVTGPTEDSWYSTPAPLNGYVITRRGVGENTSGCRFFPIVENVAGTGIIVDYAWQNQFIGGTSENGTGAGVVCTVNSQRNTFFGTDIENNTSALSDAGFGNRFYSILAGVPGASVTITGTQSRHEGGFYDAIVDNGTGTVFDTIVYGNSGGTITGTGIGQARRSVFNASTGKFDPDRRCNDTFLPTTVPNGAATTVLTLPSTGNTYYQIGAYLAGAGNAAAYGALATIYQDGATARILQQTNGSGLSITLSGMAVQVTQTSGVSQTVSAFSKPV